MTTKAKPGIAEFWEALQRFHASTGDLALSKVPGLWYKRIDGSWEIWANGHKEDLKTEDGTEIKPFHVYIQFNGWPAGIVNPHSGTICAGAAGNLENLVVAMLKAAND